ncbi:helix-turn-helix domain-containing protein [Streptomyces boninensis]|uniref:helix-turn-helix domain-containing protein n=1 Tax=Streptomyces boninensis TaxID=2039455 RepID=UPI003B21DD4A
MNVRGRAPDPVGAATAQEFNDRLRALKAWSGLSYRDIEMRAAAVGDVLPRSTVANLLGREALPRGEAVAAFVRACGCSSDALVTWLQARERLAGGGGAVDGAATAAEPVPDAGPAPAPGPGSRRPRWGPLPAALVAAAVTAALAAVAAAVLWPADDAVDSPTVTRAGREPSAYGRGTPAEGWYQIRAYHTYPDRCVDGNGEDARSDGMVVEWECTDSDDQMFYVERVPGTAKAQYRLRPRNSHEGRDRCSGFNSSGIGTGALLRPYSCEGGDRYQRFYLDVAKGTKSPVRYRLRVDRGGGCVQVSRKIDANDVANLFQNTCNGTPPQEFALRPLR